MRRYFLLGLTLFLGGASSASAAQLYLTPQTGHFQPGQTVAVDVRLDNQNECVNAADVTIGYPKDLVEAIDVSRGNSIFTIWITPPTIRPEFGLVNFIGGLPGGYCGRTPGDPAVTNTLAKLIFRFTDKVKGNAPIDIPIKVSPSSKVVLNNGQGTEAKLSVRNAQFMVAATGAPQSNEWTEALRADKTAPEPFTLGIYQDKNIFDNRWFAVWGTVDKQTGLDHYEIAEIANRKDTAVAPWKRADSPYVLTDQSLKKIILVKAFDKAGNVQLAEFTPPAPKRKVDNYVWWALASIGAIFLATFRVWRFIPWW